ncbi:MAG TPA: hypothetical protein VN840_06300 [Streptosporangiaceae bacterium]|nr:hypothetical protein [Streptosporangiaceae bacterium]
MQTPTRADPPFIPLRTSGWPSRRSPRWLLASLAVLAVIGALIGLAHRPTQGQRATDLRGFLQTLTADVGSCAAGVSESLTLLHAIDTGASHDLATAVSEVDYGVANCSPANSELVDDLTNAQAPESLASYHLQTAITALITWAAPDAQKVMADVAAALGSRGKPAQAADLTRLRLDLRALNAQRAAVYSALGPAIRALSPHSRPPVLPG